MNVLVINCGSSSLKYQLINSDTEDVLAKGLCERIGIDGRLVYQKAGCDKEITEAAMPTHKEAIQLVLEALTNEKTGAIKSLAEVNAIGHRVVHGGEKFAASAVITDEMIAAVKECNDLAPLHNPANLIGIDVCSELMPGVPQVGVFDTAASIKLGLFPFLQFAYSVNCETIKSSPFTSFKDRLVFPFSSSKIRSPSSFFKYLSATSLESS